MGCGPQSAGHNVRRALPRLNVSENRMGLLRYTEFRILPGSVRRVSSGRDCGCGPAPTASISPRLRLCSEEADGARCVGGIPPELRNHRVPTGGETPAATAAPSLDSPAAISRENLHRFSRCQTGGRPGEDNLRRVEHSDFRLPVVIKTSNIRVLRRPVESAEFMSFAWTDRLRRSGIRISMDDNQRRRSDTLAEAALKRRCLWLKLFRGVSFFRQPHRRSMPPPSVRGPPHPIPPLPSHLADQTLILHPGKVTLNGGTA